MSARSRLTAEIHWLDAIFYFIEEEGDEEDPSDGYGLQPKRVAAVEAEDDE